MSSVSIKSWIMAARPKTLTASIAPVLMGTAMAFGDGIAHWPSAVLCLLAALLIQIGTNLANDYFDHIKGADTEDRLGPTRVTQAGLIAPSTVRNGFIIVFVLSAIIAIALIQRGGIPILIITALSIASGILYTGGPKPLGYLGLGDIFVLIFFGPVAVAGTYYVQSFEMNYAIILAGFAPGFLSVAILCVNNLRDYTTDKQSNKCTLIVRFGENFGKFEYLSCILITSLLPVLIYFLINDHKAILMSSSISLMAIPIIIEVLSGPGGARLNPMLGATGKLLLIFSVLFSIGWIL